MKCVQASEPQAPKKTFEMKLFNAINSGCLVVSCAGTSYFVTQL